MIRNDEHKGKVEGMPRIVTQNYMALLLQTPQAGGALSSRQTVIPTPGLDGA